MERSLAETLLFINHVPPLHSWSSLPLPALANLSFTPNDVDSITQPCPITAALTRDSHRSNSSMWNKTIGKTLIMPVMKMVRTLWRPISFALKHLTNQSWLTAHSTYNIIHLLYEGLTYILCNQPYRFLIFANSILRFGRISAISQQ
jgi:hypothetical protein